MAFQIIRKDKAQQVVYGWASVSVDDGELVTDLQGDQIEPDELEKAVEQFMLDYRSGETTGSGVMHEGGPVSQVVASLVTTPDIVKAFGLGDGIPIGWILGLKILDQDVWSRIESRELTALSIQGSADRVPA